MASPRTHPRRSYHIAQQPLSLNIQHSENESSPVLRKGATFHSPSSPSSEQDPILNIPSLPKRSSTTLRELEDCITATPGDRIARIIGAVDRSFSGLQSFAGDNQTTIVAEGLPVPSFMVNATTTTSDNHLMDVDSSPKPVLKTQSHRKHHSSDSGIGSSLSSTDSITAIMRQGQTKTAPSESVAQTGINGTTLPADLINSRQHVLGEYACRQIQKHIIIPIIREEKLKNFHPLVSGLPHRIARKEITCLRDLEKVLLLLAPKWSVSKASFLQFCETSIQCIHATVDHLNERDQRRPTDRPYTNGYFLDLVEQIRQYAAHLAATRSRMASDERLGLVGGIGRTGRPAEIVRTKDGKTLSLRTGKEISDEEFKQGLKRSSEEIDEDLERSMARRRKSAPLVKEVQKCNECNKVFKRPCDLTKHEKTHSRPWKCSEFNCKYHEYGWPTEKERDRHVNDKHSASPSMFKCKFHPCPYESKRESNCKQHMEKAHGWTYVRSKNNGKGASKSMVVGTIPPTPVASTPGSHIFNAPTPEFKENISAFGTPASSHYRTESLNGSVITSNVSEYNEHLAPFDTTFGPLGEFNWNDTDDAFAFDNSHESWDSALNDPNVVPSTFGSLPNEEESIFGSNFDWSSMGSDLTNLNVQLATPPTSVDHQSMDTFKNAPNMNSGSLSPVGQADAMLYSPYSMHSNETIDEGYGGDYTQDLKPVADFSLFDSSPNAIGNMTNENMFQDLSAFGPVGEMDSFMHVEQ